MALVWYITKFLIPPFVKPLQDNSNKRIFFVYRFFIPWLSKLLLISWHDCHFLWTDFLTVYLCLYDSYGRQSMWEWVEFTWKTSFISARLGSCHTESCLRTWTVHVGTCSDRSSQPDTPGQPLLWCLTYPHFSFGNIQSECQDWSCSKHDACVTLHFYNRPTWQSPANRRSIEFYPKDSTILTTDCQLAFNK